MSEQYSDAVATATTFHNQLSDSQVTATESAEERFYSGAQYGVRMLIKRLYGESAYGELLGRTIARDVKRDVDALREERENNGTKTSI